MNKRRLLKLAEHLESGKLGHKKFDFSVINMGYAEFDQCGTNGCAIGELPILFPKQFKFIGSDVILREGSGGWVFGGVEKFFGIDRRESEELFVPETRHYDWGKTLGEHATRKQVAKNIRAFIAWKESQK